MYLCLLDLALSNDSCPRKYLLNECGMVPFTEIEKVVGIIRSLREEIISEVLTNAVA